MAQPNSDHVISPPNTDGQNCYDAATSAPVDRWKKLDGNAGRLSINTGRGGNHDWPGDGHWQQT